ncbi:Aste57867_25260 [Aphanomyces stellatus]|uniref:Aste57867_25260 protein n=1 Tax=Aphanomyces stellatus TaxID=120398 RepID=A0A485LSS9_9STRA|nr:hypothetical protein As57867_025182 [Aphanomyces stellatus]VFU01886.1 Aste57867_25260 [Aphanomyces stellatus]
MNLRLWTALLLLGAANIAYDVRAEDDAMADIADASIEVDEGDATEGLHSFDERNGQSPQISQEVFAQMMESISPECRAAIQESPEDASKLSDECKEEVQSTLHRLMGGKPRDPNDPLTPEVFDKMMKIIPDDCRAEVEANPNDAAKISDRCKRRIQSTLETLLARQKKKAEAPPKAEEPTKPKGKQRRGKKEPKDNTSALLIVLGFVATAIAGVVGYAYVLNQKNAALQGATGPVDRTTQKKVSKHKKEKDMRRQQAAAAASIN